MRVVLRGGVLVLSWLLLMLLATTCAPAPPRSFSVQVIWIRGADADREAFAAFLGCLLEGSNFQAYWQGEAQIRARGSFVVDPPAEPLDLTRAAAFLEPLVERGELPATPAGETAVYLLIGPATALAISECGRTEVQSVLGSVAGVSMVRTSPSCWPGTAPLRNETQLGQHELTEAVDVLLGYEGCAADGACEGNLACADACDNFTGLTCPGAPTQTFTGCGKVPLDGWIVQKLGHEGRLEGRCNQCIACDFTVRANP